MRFIAFVLIFGISLNVYAQKKNSQFDHIEEVMLVIPDSLTSSTSGISNYIDLNFTTETDKSRALFFWITSNIEYDIDNLFAINFYKNANEVIDEVLRTKKGICMHYAELYNLIANKIGIRSYVVSGYTNQNGYINYVPHVWCASNIDSNWYLIDPTLGSGYIKNSKFYKKINYHYFKTEPEQIIKTHMPFDPLWQLLNYPFSNKEFYEGKTTINKLRPFFDFHKLIKQFEQLTEIEKLETSSKRIEQNGVQNALVFDRLQHIKRDIEYYNNKMLFARYNSAVNLYNEGINQLNRFINFRNKQFLPKKTDAEIQEMVDLAINTLNNSREKLKEIESSNFENSVIQLNNSIDEAMLNLNEQNEFLDKYFKTGIMSRKSLFYNSKWKGYD